MSSVNKVLNCESKITKRLEQLSKRKDITSEKLIKEFMSACLSCMTVAQLQRFNTLGLSLTKSEISWSQEKGEVKMAPLFALALAGNTKCVEYCFEQGYRFPNHESYAMLLHELMADIEEEVKSGEIVEPQFQLMKLILDSHKYIA